MRNTVYIAAMLLAGIMTVGCTSEKQKKDRTEAEDMFRNISILVSHFTTKVETAPDSASWAKVCVEFEDSLDKISLSYSPDTDLLLTEGQNDTIQSLIQAYLTAKNSRINEIMHPVVEEDSISDSTVLTDESLEISQADASRSRGN